ncbi:MAG: methyltransferase domain-containing protein [Proteobacteria bacterium]|nr:methyltransferase domain-containing protein [Pseudomonadota bacterium]
MESPISREDLQYIQESIRNKYQKVSQSPEGRFFYPTGKKGLAALVYDKALVDRLPEEVAAFYCGVGNPFSLGKINPGDQVLDVGCGAGVDTLIAAMMAGPEGGATGVDIVPEMLARAESNLRLTGLTNVRFELMPGEDLPFPGQTFDVVISNGVINLIPDKKSALENILRVLKPGGRLMMADQVAAGLVQKDLETRLKNWFQ